MSLSLSFDFYFQPQNQPGGQFADVLAAATALRVRNDLDDFAPVRSCALLLDAAVPYAPAPPAQHAALAAVDALLGAWGGRISTKGGNLDRAKTKDLLVRVRSKLGLMAARTLYGARTQQESMAAAAAPRQVRGQRHFLRLGGGSARQLT